MRGVRPRQLFAVLVAAVALLAVDPLPAPASGAEVHQVTERIGTSVDGRPIVAIHRWTDGATRTLMVVGNMHGEEQAGLRVVRRLRTAALPVGLDLWLVPTMNPDGTPADRRTNGHGVDLNRNFPMYWLSSGAGTRKWSGPSPASEPETRAMMRLLRRVAPRTVLIFHQPLFGVDSYRAKSMRLVRRLSRDTGLPIKPFDCHDGCHGTLTDWYNTHLDGRAVTIEFARTASSGRIGRVARALLTIGLTG
jgi:hypothetical protein